MPSWSRIASLDAYLLRHGRVTGLVSCPAPDECRWAVACGDEPMGEGVAPTKDQAKRMVEVRARYCPRS